MKILFDHQIFSYQEYGGVSRYFYEIINRLPISNWDICCNISNNYLFEKLAAKKGLNYHHFFKNFSFWKKQRIMLEIGKIYSNKIIKNEDYDILHLTHYESYCINNTKKPIVITYHDKLFSSYEYNQRTINEQKKCVANAAAVICISENTKKDFLSFFDYPENKVHVIYHGVNTLPEIPDNNCELNCEKYILYVGGRRKYKNFENLAIAFSLLSKIYDDLFLYCTGTEFTNEEKVLLQKLSIYDKVKAKYVSDEELAHLYHNAKCFVFPSKYEGFGMPLLEAMNYDCPICCSNAHCFPEIASDAALFFNPENPNDIANKIQIILSDNILREKLIKSGKNRIKFFSWEKSTEEHINLYKQLL